MNLDEVAITQKMREEAYFVFKNSWARSNADYPIALEIYEQLYGKEEHLPFQWEISDEIYNKAKEINDFLFQEYLEDSKYM